MPTLAAYGRKIRRILIWAVPLALLLTLAGGYFACKGRTYTFYITEQDIQQAADTRIPYQKGYMVLAIRATGVEIDLAEGSDRIGVSLDFELQAGIGEMTRTYTGRIKGSSAIAYQQESYSVHLVDPAIDEVRIEALPDIYSQPLTRLALQVIQRVADRRPIHQIKDQSLRDKLARAFLKQATITNGRLAVTLGY